MEDETFIPGPDNGKEPTVNESDVEIGGGGRTPLRLPITILIQLAGIIFAAAIAVVSVQAKVDHVTSDHDREVATNAEILKRVTELDAKVDYLTKEIWYIRERTDRQSEKEGKRQ